MRLGKLARSTPFRLAALYVLLFILSLSGGNVVAYNMVAAYLYERLDSHVMERYREIESAYEARGIDGAAAMIGSHGPAIRGQETLYLLRGVQGEFIAGNFRVPAVPTGFSTFTAEVEGGSSTNYRLYRGGLGDQQLVVGVSYDDTNRLRWIALVSFGWATAIVLGAGLGGGALLAFRTRRRIAVLSDTMKLVGEGHLGTRLPVSARQDDLDLLAVDVNSALEQLETSVAAMKQVTTDIAHDLKTPIGRLYLTLEDAIEKVADDATAKAVLETAVGEVLQISGTFEALLRISQIEAGARRRNFAPVRLDALVEEMLEIHQPIAEESGKQLSLLPGRGPSGSEISGDHDLLRQMCANLLANAIRHTPYGARIALASGLERNRPFLIVADNGPGIPEAERQKVFKRFYRLDKSRTSEGTGLGLSLVKAVADLHGADIVLSDRSPGLAVRVVFPAAAASGLTFQVPDR
ncbi:HAMP domain-containing sensor histidine kinase [Aliihoeflea sp. 40Bstr573]|uniref:sensor histidine kinase n=1 Tax=Aliihoeflea sp. 40Bstr573 TaxID=2696467 RepID=UPI002095B972|nr:HAMP domain-containing sensor histidine kinase [Aliihoeflea sp. 40Bstr573]MCO6386672.1 HAMP domain-containing protein [Aliihoeflea sp. 40Bstr573]